MLVLASRVDELAPNAHLIDWKLATRVGRFVTAGETLGPSYLGRALQTTFDEVTEQAAGIVSDLTGLSLDRDPRAVVLDRGDWVEANISSMGWMLGPLFERINEQAGKNQLAPAGRLVAGAETGALLGFMAHRVLGQYEALMPQSAELVPGTAGAVWFVGPNILNLEKKYAFRPNDFRLWIAIHEVTHQAQFTGVPWMREYFLGLVHELIAHLNPDPRQFVDSIKFAAEEIRHGRDPLAGGVVTMMASQPQRELIERVQALMSLLEGHGNLVMNAVDPKLVPGQERMARILHSRRQARGPMRIFQRLVGIEMKLRQYEIGEAFALAVTRTHGIRALDAAWSAPENLPTSAELSAPQAWIERVGVSGAA